MSTENANVARVGVLTRDFGLYHDLVRTLRARAVAFDSLAFDETPRQEVGVVLTSWRDVLLGGLPPHLPVATVPLDTRGGSDVDGGISMALRLLAGTPRHLQVVIGVDPGTRPGLAVLADGVAVHLAQAPTVAEAVRMVLRLVERFPADHLTIRIGNGSPRDRDRIVAGVLPLGNTGAALEIVDETGTTPARGASGGLPLDVAAALEIAGTPGGMLAGRRHQPTDREVRNVQRMSRERSSGRFTISGAVAAEVAAGRMSMDDALLHEQERLTRKNRSV